MRSRHEGRQPFAATGFSDLICWTCSAEGIIGKSRIDRQIGKTIRRSCQRLTFLGWMERVKSGIHPLHAISQLKHQRDIDVMIAACIKILARLGTLID